MSALDHLAITYRYCRVKWKRAGAYSRRQRWLFFNIVVSMATLAGVVIAVVSGIVQYTETRVQVDALRASNRNQQFAQVITSIGADNSTERVIGLYDLRQYAKTYPVTRAQVLHIISADLKLLAPKIAHGNEGAVVERSIAAGLLTKVTTFGEVSKVPTFDLAHANLRGADMSGLVARGSFFMGTDFTYAIMVGADLSGADLSGATFTKTDLTCVDAENAILRNATLTGVEELDRINLTGADLRQATIGRHAFGRVYWERGDPPKWPQGLRPPPRAGGPRAFLQACSGAH